MVHPGLDGAFGHGEHLGNFPVMHALDECHFQHDALFVRQHRQAKFDPPAILRRVVGVGRRFVGFQQYLRQRVTAAITKHMQQLVAGNAEQPGRDPCIPLETFRGLPGGQQGFVDHVIDCICRAAGARQEPRQPAAKILVQQFQPAHIACGHQRHSGAVAAVIRTCLDDIFTHRPVDSCFRWKSSKLPAKYRSKTEEMGEIGRQSRRKGWISRKTSRFREKSPG